MARARSATLASGCLPDSARLSRLALSSSIVSALLLFGSPTALFAQTNDQQSIKLGETDLYPALEIQYIQNNNAYLEPAGSEVESSGVVISPEFNWVADRRLLTLRGNYTGSYGRQGESALDFNDHLFRLDAAAELTARKRTKGKVELEFGHQDLGAGFTRGTADGSSDAVTFTRFLAQGDYTYGAKTAKGNVTGGAKVVSHTFTSRSDLTSGDDYTAFEPFGIFSYRLSPAARALAEIRVGIFSFGNSNLDRNDISILTGLEFAQTEKSGGSIKIGSSLSDFSASGRDKESNLLVEGSLFYKPKSYSEIKLTLNRSLDNDSGSPVENLSIQATSDEVDLEWRHEWSSRVYSNINVGYRGINRGCPSNDVATNLAGIELNFKIRRWVEFGLSADYSKRTASICSQNDDSAPDLDYERQLVGAHVRATL